MPTRTTSICEERWGRGRTERPNRASLTAHETVGNS